MKSAWLKYLLLLGVLPVVLSLTAFYFYRQSIYSVLNYDPLWLMSARENLDSLSSPGGSRLLHLTVQSAVGKPNRYFTWVTVNDWLRGKKIVAQDYISEGVRFRREPFPVQWIDETQCRVTFLAPDSETPAEILLNLEQ